MKPLPRASILVAICMVLAGPSPGAEPPRIVPQVPHSEPLTSWVRGPEDADPRLVVTASRDGTAHVYHEQSLRRDSFLAVLRRVLPGHFVALGAGGREIVTATSYFSAEKTSSLDVWSADGERLLHLDIDDQVLDLATSADGSRLVVLGREAVRVFRRADGELVGRLPRPRDFGFYAMAVSQAGNVVAARGGGGVLVGDLDDGERRFFERCRASADPQVAVSADGRVVATADDDFEVLVWDARTGERLRRLDGHRDRVTRLALSADGRYLLSGSMDRSARLWDLETENPPKVSTHLGSVLQVALSPRGDLAYVGTMAGENRIWHTATGKPAPHLASHGVLDLPRFGDDGLLYSSHFSGLLAWDPSTGKVVKGYRGLEQSVSQLGFAAAGDWLIAAHHGPPGKFVRLWNPSTGQVITVDGERFAVAADRHLAAGPTRGRVQLWRLDERTLVAELADEEPITTFAADPRRPVMVTATESGHLSVWDAESGERLRRLRPRPRAAAQLVVDAERRLLFVAYRGGVAYAYDLESGEVRFELKMKSENEVGVFRQSPDGGRFVASSFGDDRLYTWDLDEGRRKRRHFEGVFTRTVAFTGGGRILVPSIPSRQTRFQAYELGGRSTVDFAGHRGRVTTLAVHGERAASGGVDRRVLVWPLDTDDSEVEPLRVLEGHDSPVRALAWHPDGSLLVSGDHGGALHLWRAATGEALGRLYSPFSAHWAVVAPDGRWDASDGGQLNLLRWQDGRPGPLDERPDLHAPGLLRTLITPQPPRVSSR